MRKLIAQVPDGYILYSNATKFSYVTGDNIISKTPEFKMEITGTLVAYLIKKVDLSDSLINKLLPEIGIKEKFEILQPDLSQLTFNFADKEQSISKDITNFDFDLTGNLLINWSPNIDELKSLLLNKNKEEVSYIFKNDPGISSAGVKIIPFWCNYLPQNSNNIKITLKNLTKN